jgi:hypothetical protein
MSVVIRSDIKKILLDWQLGKLSAQEVHTWASDIYFPGKNDFEDWDEVDDVSSSNEVLSYLDNLDINLATSEDVPTLLALLEADPAHYQTALLAFEDALNKIDFEKRAEQLKNISPYDKVLKDSQ